MRGITVILHEKIKVGIDDFKAPIYEEVPVSVDNVLVAPTTADDIIDTKDLEGRRAVYTLAIPKGDTHDWKNAKIEFFGQTWKSFGIPQEGIGDLIPLAWNKKVTVERYE